jgi:hypothetical protein
MEETVFRKLMVIEWKHSPRFKKPSGSLPDSDQPVALIRICCLLNTAYNPITISSHHHPGARCVPVTSRTVISMYISENAITVHTLVVCVISIAPVFWSTQLILRERSYDLHVLLARRYIVLSFGNVRLVFSYF